MAERFQCIAEVRHRDCYRVSRGGKRHFAMHYTKAQCSRAAVSGEFCRQHAAIAAWSRVPICRWATRPPPPRPHPMPNPPRLYTPQTAAAALGVRKESNMRILVCGRRDEGE